MTTKIKMAKTITEIRNGATPKSGEFKKFWNMVNTSDTEGEIFLYGEVCSEQPTDWFGDAIAGNYITPEGFLQDLQQIQDKQNIKVHLNSVGGDFYTGLAISNVLKGLPANITMIVESIAASAGSIIMCAGDEVQVYPGSIIMVHGVSYGLCDWYNLVDLRQLIAGGEACERSIAQIYAAKTGRGIDELQGIITENMWMTGQEAIDEGFANTLLDGKGPDVSLENNGKILVSNGLKFDMGDLKLPEKFNLGAKNSPDLGKMMTDFMSQMKSIVQGGQNKTTTEEISNNIANVKTTNEEKGGTIVAKTIEELKNECPELVAQIENAANEQAKQSATEAERQRIQEIEKIEASIGDTELINAAKYGEKTCTAAELALQAMQKQTALGTAHLNNIQQDAEASKTTGVGATANGGTITDGADKKQNLVNGLTNALKKINGGKK